MMPMSTFTRTFRRTLRKAHLRLVYSSDRSHEENKEAFEDAIRRVGAALPVDFPAEDASGITNLLVIENSAIVGVARRDRDPAMVQQEINGCKSLLLEIIRRAAYDWVLYRTSRRLLHKKLAEQAYEWLFVEEPGDENDQERRDSGKLITSFLAICEALELDPESVRTHVRRLTPKNVMSVGRPAEYRRRESQPHTTEEAPVSLSAQDLPAGWNDVEDHDE